MTPSGASTITGWLKPRASSIWSAPLGDGPVADADDLEVLVEAVGDADDHVVDQAAGQAVQGPVLALVVGALDQQGRVLLADGDLAGHGARQSVPLGPLTVTCRSAMVDLDAGRDRDGDSSDSGHG